jgi:hypothetical protein
MADKEAHPEYELHVLEEKHIKI